MTQIVLTVDCEAALHDRAYTREYLDVLEEAFVPATWLLQVSKRDPSANVNLYFHEFQHKIPSWHELGLKVTFENERGYVEDPKERGEIVWLARDSVKSHVVKPTAVRIGACALLPTDVPYLEEAGLKVDLSVVPDGDYKMFVDWAGAPKTPFRGSKDSLTTPGDNRLLHLPIATHEGKHATLDNGFEAVRAIVDGNAGAPVLVLTMRDYVDKAEDLRKTIAHLKGSGARFVTATQAASEVATA